MSLRFSTLFAPWLLMVAFLFAMGCKREVSPPPKPPSWNSEAVSGIPFHLVPLRLEGKEPRLPPTELIDKLFAGLNDDATTKKLVSKLHGGADVTFLARKMTEAEVEKIAPSMPPAKGHAVFWAISNWIPNPVDDATEKIAPGRKLHMPVYLAWTYRTRLECNLPYSFPILTAVINDHLLRHNLGYQIQHGRVSPRLEPMPGDQRPLTEVRADVDTSIQKLLSDFESKKKSSAQ